MAQERQLHDASGFRFPSPDDVFQLRVSLVGITPSIWRRLLVPQDIPLPRFHRVLQVAMGWTDAHLHEFTVGDVRFGVPDAEFEPGPIDYRRITLNQIAPRKGAGCVYEYDFGDSWEHLIEVEDELPADTVSARLPCCLAGERACPPEDVGGAAGYAEFLAAFDDPSHPEHESWRRSMGPGFAPSEFDIDGVNAVLASLGARGRSAASRVPRRRQ
jgi:hypothetical protein